MHCLPDKKANAAENMATDQAMLTDYVDRDLPRFRHYGWMHSAFTFGFAQTWGHELDTLINDGHEVVRRETGGGLVDHRNDWTYSLVIPLTHQRGQETPTAIYRDIHICLIKALQAQEAEAILQDQAPPPKEDGVFSACFNRAELNDVITKRGEKIAGAAQRRNREGFLIQGYINGQMLPDLDWAAFRNDFAESLGQWLESPAKETDWPNWNQGSLNQLITRFASEAWNKRRKRN